MLYYVVLDQVEVHNYYNERSVFSLHIVFLALKIHISETTKALLEVGFKTERRGTIEVKVHNQCKSDHT